MSWWWPWDSLRMRTWPLGALETSEGAPSFARTQQFKITRNPAQQACCNPSFRRYTILCCVALHRIRHHCICNALPWHRIVMQCIVLPIYPIALHCVAVRRIALPLHFTAFHCLRGCCTRNTINNNNDHDICTYSQARCLGAKAKRKQATQHGCLYLWRLRHHNDND